MSRRRAVRVPAWQTGGVPARAARTRRPRLLPAAMLASALVVGTGAATLAATGGSPAPAAETCAGGSEYVTVRPVVEDSGWKPPAPAGPVLAGCVDSDELREKAAEPTPTNPRG